MKKLFKSYLILWAILLVLFNVIAFVSVGWSGQEKYTASFWIGYIAIMLMFGGQLYCAYLAFKADTAKKLFYNLSLIRISYTGLMALETITPDECMLKSFINQGYDSISYLCRLANERSNI